MISGWALWVAVIFLTAVVAELLRANALLVRNIQQEASLGDGEARCTSAVHPLISIVIPAQDEEGQVGICLQSILASDCKHIEVLVVDDRSTDHTREIVASVCEQDPRVRLMSMTDLPEGWTGKTHALYCGT